MVYPIKVEWTVEFYEEPNGRAPVEEFLDSLRPEGLAKALALLQALKMHGSSLPFPYSSQVAGRIRELRTQYGRDKIRILYYADAPKGLHSAAWIREADCQTGGVRTGQGRIENGAAQ